MAELVPLVAESYAIAGRPAQRRGGAVPSGRGRSGGAGRGAGRGPRRRVRRGVTRSGRTATSWPCRSTGWPAAPQASQGEQRSLALALRLRGHRLVTERRARPPLLLLDDVFSELDPDRAPPCWPPAGRAEHHDHRRWSAPGADGGPRPSTCWPTAPGCWRERRVDGLAGRGQRRRFSGLGPVASARSGRCRRSINPDAGDDRSGRGAAGSASGRRRGRRDPPGRAAGATWWARRWPARTGRSSSRDGVLVVGLRRPGAGRAQVELDGDPRSASGSRWCSPGVELREGHGPHRRPGTVRAASAVTGVCAGRGGRLAAAGRMTDRTAPVSA